MAKQLSLVKKYKLTRRSNFPNLAYIFGWLLADIGFLHQIYKVFYTRSAEDISLIFATLLIIGYCFMAVRSITSGFVVWWVAHLIAIALGVALLTGVLQYS